VDKVVVQTTTPVVVTVVHHHSVTIVHQVVDKVLIEDNNMMDPLVATLTKVPSESMVDHPKGIGTLLV
jgi:hypothetical protein